MTKINTRLWPQPFTAGKWDEIGEWDVKKGTTAKTEEEVGVGRFMLHLENILALGDAVQRHAASEGISCQL